MALTLTANLGTPTQLDSAIRLAVTGTVPAAIGAGYLFRLDDEVLELRYFGETQQSILGGAATQTVDDRNVWYAQRGLNGTTIATHASGTTVLGVADPALVAGGDEDVPEPFAGGGGTSVHGELEGLDAADGHPQSAVTGLEAALAALTTVVTDTTSPVFADTTDTDATLTGGGPGAFEAGQVGWLVSGLGIPNGATILSVDVDGTTAEMSAPATATGSLEARLTEPAPTPTFAGMLWRRGEGTGASFSVRNVANDDWIALGPAYYDLNGWLTAQVIFEPPGSPAGGNLTLQQYGRANGAFESALIRLGMDGIVTIFTGAERLIIEGLPTADPGGGAVWLDSGLLRIGPGA